MTGQVFDTIGRWLGWCPNVHAESHRIVLCREENIVVPPDGGSYKSRIAQWLCLFHNQILVQTIGTLCLGLYLFFSLGGVIHPDLFLFGILIGLPFSAIYGFWYWRIYNEVFQKGPVVLRYQFSVASSILVVVSVLVIMYAQVSFLTGLTPWFDTSITNAFMGGFISVSFMGVFVSVWKWEADTQRQLHYDGLVLELGKEGNHALY